MLWPTNKILIGIVIFIRGVAYVSFLMGLDDYFTTKIHYNLI